MSNPVPPEQQFYSTTEVARIFSVSAETVVEWIKTGKLEAIRIAGRYRVRVESVKALAEAKYGS